MYDIVCVESIPKTCFYAQIKVQPGNKDRDNAHEFVIGANWKESSLCGSYDVGIYCLLIIVQETVRLHLSKRTTKTTPASANGINKRRLILEHSLHCDVPRARLSPGRQAPHNTPLRLKAHCSCWLKGSTLVKLLLQ